MLQFMQTMPQAAELVMDLLVKNFDWPGAEELADRFRKVAVAQGIVEPDPEKGEQPPPQPPPNPDMVKAETEADKAEAGIVKTGAETEGEKTGKAQSDGEMRMAGESGRGGGREEGG